MPDINEEKTRQLVKISTFYYLDGLSQQEIAEQLSVSRSHVSRMLSTAKSEGIVQITIKNPYGDEQQYERQLKETFGIKNAVVINVPDADQQMIDLHLARAGAVLLESIIKHHDIIGIMAGKSVNLLAQEMPFFSRKNLKFVPLVGGWGAEGATWHANSNTRLFGEKLKSKYFLINAPAVVVSKQARDIIMAEREISDVIELARQAAVSVVGIGTVSEEDTIVTSGYFSKEDLHRLRDKGAEAVVCTSFLDQNGNVIKCEEESRMIGLSVHELKNAQNVMAIASGRKKAAAIGAALRGGWIDFLITDMATAKEVLSLHHSAKNDSSSHP
ncbi:sugar-binding transcriptional regulator [Bacillus sonorensis]|uniref:Transcriptional regulator n=2 Tax=Bacillus sonorensis TaxID=119858 RepID=M5PEV5_9BACI|nr:MULTISPECIES: sugar-binding transcriptional regulator [Bacillus]TWK76253.1 Deoxyribonucleoside regulator [Bacillus paralicheniformis]ASB88253.1 Transcriptional regulator LsrR [Bacillus sonorensis]EME74982.1 transcriptional regulator [Bacillus sonorensis L12]MBG9916104.1 MarR family transcriptional regulator [Bacillus sonorensis]MCF7617672.1 sugar-binding transcriptional regulator [Bacillus sonorensis]